MYVVGRKRDFAWLLAPGTSANVDASAHVDTTHYVDASARKSGIVKPIRIIVKGDRRQAPETGQLVAVRPQAEAREVGAYELDQYNASVAVYHTRRSLLMATIRLDTVFLITLLVVSGALVACGTQAQPADHPSGPSKGPPPEMLRQAEQFERRMMDHRRQMERQRMDLNRMRDEMRGRAERERERLQQARKDLQEREQRLKVKSSKLATVEANLRAARSADLEGKITVLEDQVTQLEALVAALEQRAATLIPETSK